MVSAAQLVRQLSDQPTAPTEGFDRFLVGEAQRHRLQLVRQLKSIVEGAPSTLRVILGPNGNGKTLLNHALQAEASRININLSKGIAAHTVLFARVSVDAIPNPANVGLQLTQALRRSIWEPTRSTYSTIATALVERFVADYKLPLHWRALTLLPRFALNRLMREYRDAVGQLAIDERVTESSEDLVEKAIAASDRVIQSAVSSWRVRRALSRYLREYQLGGFLDEYISLARDTRLSQAEINRGVHAALMRGQEGMGLLQSASAIAEVAAGVKCQCLMLMLDDCNTPASQRQLLGLVDSLGQLASPRVFLVVSAVPELWDAALNQNPGDEAPRQKLHIYGDPLLVEPPTEDDLIELLPRLEALTAEAIYGTSYLTVNQNFRADLIGTCRGLSFREAVKRMIDSLAGQARNAAA